MHVLIHIVKVFLRILDLVHSLLFSSSSYSYLLKEGGGNEEPPHFACTRTYHQSISQSTISSPFSSLLFSSSYSISLKEEAEVAMRNHCTLDGGMGSIPLQGLGKLSHKCLSWHSPVGFNQQSRFALGKPLDLKHCSFGDECYFLNRDGPTY